MTECKFSQLACSVRKLFAFTLCYIVTAYSLSSQSGFAASGNFLASVSTFAARLVGSLYISVVGGGGGKGGESQKQKGRWYSS